MTMTHPVNIGKALSIKGWMSHSELEWLAKTANESRNIIEVGCFRGRSTRALADNTAGIVTCCDPWIGPYYDNNYKNVIINLDNACFYEFIQNLSDHVDSGKIKVFRGPFSELPLMIKSDFVFIDGDHHYQEVVKDILKAKKHLMDGGIIAGHDYGRDDWPGVKQAVDELLGETNHVSTIWWKEYGRLY